MEELLLSTFAFAFCLFPRFAFAGPPREGGEVESPEDPTGIIEIRAPEKRSQPPAAEGAPPSAPAPVLVADPGDARPDAPPKADPLLEVEGKVGPKQLPASVAVYGIIATNGVYISGTVGPTDESAVFVSPGSHVGPGLGSDGALLISARQTRLGVKSNIQLTDKLDAGGQIEVDFFGLHENAGPPGVVQGGLRVRLLKLEFGSAKHRLIAGQDFSVISPRLPTSLSHMAVAVHTQGGAIYNRLPQITYLFKQPLAKSKLANSRFQLQLSAARSLSGDGLGGGITRADGPDPGTAGKLPLAQARIAFESDVLSVGVAGQIGRENYQVARLDANNNLITIDDHVPTWLASGDLQVKTKWVWVAGQGYYGVNLNGMLSNQGVRHDVWTTTEVVMTDPRLGLDRDVLSVPAYGGWAEFGALLGTPKVKLVTSAGADIGRRDLVAEGARWLNLGGFVGLIYAPFEVFDMSIEYLRQNTYYKRADPTAPIEQRMGVNDYVAVTFRLKF